MRFFTTGMQSAFLGTKTLNSCCKLLLSLALLLPTLVRGQDFCSNAVALCVNNTVAATTLNATTSAGDPALGCGDATLNNNVWFTFKAISNGNCTVTVT